MRGSCHWPTTASPSILVRLSTARTPLANDYLADSSQACAKFTKTDLTLFIHPSTPDDDPYNDLISLAGHSFVCQSRELASSLPSFIWNLPYRACTMQPHGAPETRMQNAFGPLPVELFLSCLDQLVGTHDGRTPIAYEPTHEVTKTLRALTFVSRTAYICASRYLYTHCLYISDASRHSLFRRTFNLDLGNHPLALEYGQAGRNEELFTEADIQRHVTSLFISPERAEYCKIRKTPRVRLPQMIDLCMTIGSTLKRLVIDFNPVYVPTSEQVTIKPYCTSRGIFLQMPNLEELVCSYETSDYFCFPPPNLKRLAMTANDMEPFRLDFFFMQSSLEMLFMIRPERLTAGHVDELFRRYHGRHLDVVFVDLNKNHFTPSDTRDWTADDKVTVWEVDVPNGFYSDDEDLILADNWIWTHGVRGDLWEQDKRQMRSWTEVETMLAGVP